MLNNVPTLQQVTTAGDTTNKGIVITDTLGNVTAKINPNGSGYFGSNHIQFYSPGYVNITSELYPDGLFNIGQDGNIGIGDLGPDVNGNAIYIQDASNVINLSAKNGLLTYIMDGNAQTITMNATNGFFFYRW